MKKLLSLLMIITVLLCSSAVPTYGAEKKIVFPDKNMEAAVREIMGKASGSIYPSDAAKITEMELFEKNISNIDGIQYFTGLKYLGLAFNNISDISKLSGLTGLEELFLCSNKKISDITPLSGLVNLKSLSVADNNVTDITPLKKLKKLTLLLLSMNPIKDYSPVKDIYPNLETKDFELTGNKTDDTGRPEADNSQGNTSKNNSDNDDRTDNSEDTSSVPSSSVPYSGEWTSANSGATEELNSVAYGNGVYIAVGNNGCIIKSNDALTWETVSSPVKTELRKVIWNGKQFAAVGNNSTILYSQDGTIWKNVSITGFKVQLNDLVWDGSKFIIVGNNVIISASKLGNYSVNVIDKAFFTSIVFDGRLYAAAGYSTSSFLSTITRTEDKYDGTYVITETTTGTKYSSFIYSSADGTDWGVTSAGSRLNCGATNGKEIVFICDNGYYRIYKEKNGDYNLTSLDTAEYFNVGYGGAAWDGEKYLVTVGMSVDVLFSNPKNESKGLFEGHSSYRKENTTDTAGDFLNGITVSESTAVAVGQGGTVFVARRDNSKPLFTVDSESTSDTQKNLVIKVNGKTIKFSSPAVIKGSDYLASAKTLCKALNAEYKYDSKAAVITITKGKTVLKLKLNEKYMTKGKIKLSIGTAAVFDKTALVPVKAIAEALGYTCSYDAESAVLSITAK